MVLAASGLAGKADEQTAIVKPAILSEFIIMAHSGPPPEEVTLERYQEVADAGIDYLVPGNGVFDKAGNLKALDLAQEVGIKVVPLDMRMLSFAFKPNTDLDEELIRQLAKDYRDHPALGGYLVKDEPEASQFPILRAISDLLRDEDPAHEPLINLFPNYGTIHQFGVSDYSTYIRDYLKTVKPGLLAYDSYPLRLEGKTIYDDWYSNLGIVRKEALKAGIPFLVFMQSEGIKERLRVPNRAGILWQANTALAYGAQGVGWFCYWTPESTMGFSHVEGTKAPVAESHHNSMLHRDGTRSKVYSHVREANLYLKKAGNGLLGWKSVGIARFKAGKMLKGGSSPVAVPEGDRANVVIGTFEKDGKTRLVISNAGCEKLASIWLTLLSDEQEVAGVFAAISVAPAGEKDSLIEWYLAPGGSIVLDLK